MLTQENEVPKSFHQSVIDSIEEKVQEAENNNYLKGRKFLEWVLPRLFEITHEQVENQEITDRSHDEGIDVWDYIETGEDDEESGVVRLFQVKYGKTYDIEKEVAGFERDISTFLRKKPYEIKRDDLRELHNKINEERYRIDLFLITNQSINVKARRKCKIIGIDQIVTNLWEEIAGKPKGKQAKLTLEKFMPYEKSLIGVVSPSELVRFVTENESYIFESNIRKYLQKTKVNKGLIQTLRDRVGDLFYFNNGITIVAKKFDVEDHSILLYEPQIVNGAQTSSIIAEYLPRNTRAKGGVQVTIIKSDDEATRAEITQYRNSQNAVKGRDLISLQAFHAKIHAELHLKRYYYEQQAGAWIAKPVEEKNRYTGEDAYNKYLGENHDHVIPAYEAIQAMVAGLWQNPTKPYSSIASFLPSGTFYPKIFTHDLPEDFRLLFYPYLVKIYATDEFGYGTKDDSKQQKQYARLLFVTVYFKILTDFIIKRDLQEIRNNPFLMEKYFKNFETNSKLLRFCHQAIENNYFPNAMEYYNKNEISTWHNFFAQHSWKPELIESLTNYVKYNKDELEKIRREFR